VKPRIIELKELVKTEEALKWLECLYSNVPDSSYEASAYDAVLNIAKNLEEKLIREKEKTEKLREALEFYADISNPNSIFDPDYDEEDDDCEFIESTQFTHFGKRAREALKE